jgi:two-component system NarL family sensor kinase
LKTTRRNRSARSAPGRELAGLRIRLAESQAALRAIRRGEVDAVVVAGKAGPQVFTLKGAGHAYRLLIESMNEGALTLTADKMILYANECFARMVKCPLEQVTGGSFRRFFSAEDRAVLKPLLKRGGKSGSKIQALLNIGDGSKMPVRISICPLPRHGSQGAAIGMVVTDMTETRRTEGLLRALSHRVVQVQEAERGRVSLELHDNITQLLCAVLVRSHALADALSSSDVTAKGEAIMLREMLSHAAQEVERISRNLRPGVLNELGLVAVLRDAGTEFARRTGVSLKLVCARRTARLAANTELAIYRIFQEALNNVEQHAHARHVTVCLRKRGQSVQLTIDDDGVGFDLEHHLAGRNGRHGFGLLSMSERAAYIGGAFKIKSLRRAGTKLEVRIPLPS